MVACRPSGLPRGACPPCVPALAEAACGEGTAKRPAGARGAAACGYPAPAWGGGKTPVILYGGVTLSELFTSVIHTCKLSAILSSARGYICKRAATLTGHPERGESGDRKPRHGSPLARRSRLRRGSTPTATALAEAACGEGTAKRPAGEPRGRALERAGVPGL